MEPADLINGNQSDTCPGASQVTLLFFVECQALRSETIYYI